MSNIKTIQCPSCGAKKLKYLDDNMFECLNCQTSFYVDSNQTSVNHKHTYTNAPSKPISFNSKRALYVFLGFIVFGFLLLIPVLFFTTNNKSGSTFTTGESPQKKDFHFRVSSSSVFTDQSNNLKIFMIGNVQASNYSNDKHRNQVYWAVYDAVKGSFDQINPLQKNNEIITQPFGSSESFKFDDGNIYSHVGNTLLFKYDVNTKSQTFLNNEIISSVKELQSGISRIEDPTCDFSAFEIKSNSDKEVMYYPISKVSYTDNFRSTVIKQSYPNEKPTTFFYHTRNQPSYLVKYSAMHSTGYPFCFDPIIESKFDENENFISAAFGSYWIAASHVINMEVLNTENKVYDMTVLDFRDGIVALGVKTNNISSEKFKIQWQDYNGKLLWSSPSEVSHLYNLSGTISKSNGLLFGHDEEYHLYNNQGKYIKKIDLNELSFDLD